MRCLPVSVCLSLVGVASCVESADESLVGVVEQGICTIAECGTNSPVIDTIGFHELSEDTNVENAQGFKVVDLWKNNQSYALDVVNGKITGKIGNVVALQGAQLQFAQIRVQRGSVTYGIRIAAVNTSVQLFAKLNGMPKFIEAYNLDYRNLSFPPGTAGPPFVALCDDINARRDALGLSKELSVVFEGEGINEGTKTISPILDNKRINIACSGHALAKMVMSAQTHSAAALGFTTSTPKSQAFLKMVTGDYCGNGTPFTVSGQLLQWKDTNGYMPYLTPPATIEARWTAGGATCINKSLNGLRINAHHTPLGDATFQGDVRDDVADECFINACSDASPHNLNGAFFVSANPF